LNSSTQRVIPAAGAWDGSGATQRVSALHAEGLRKTFGMRTVLHPFELEIPQGEIRALLGQNGSGKSTLIKILSGFHMPDEQATCLVRGKQLEFGSPAKSGELGLRFVHQDLGLIASTSVLDNLAYTRGFQKRFGTIRGKAELARARAALDMVGLHIDPKVMVASLTPAQQTGVAVARAVYQDDEGSAAVLVLDEPTATLPLDEVEHLHAMIRATVKHGLGVLYVTHHLDEVFRLADTVSVLRDGHLVESCDVKGIDHATLIHRLVGSELEAVTRERTPAIAAKQRGTTLRISDIHSDFVRGVSLDARSGEIVGIYGLTGSGRESILGAVFGAVPRAFGDVEIDGKSVPPFSPVQSIAAGIGYLPPDRKVNGGVMQLDATENLTMVNVRPFWKAGFLRGNLERSEARAWFERLQVSPRDGVAQPLASFSGGNQQKIVLGKWLRMGSRVLLLDEPTQGVDVGAKAQLHRVIMEAASDGAIVLLSSTDLEELTAICDRVIVLRHGTVSADLTGDDVNEARITRELLTTTPGNSGATNAETQIP
jgi:ribose transport system ATP-binding protein